MNEKRKNPHVVALASASDCEFRHHLYDVLILLGCRKDIADLLKKSEDGWVTGDDVDELRRYAITLVDGMKGRLSSLNRMAIRTS